VLFCFQMGDAHQAGSPKRTFGRLCEPFQADPGTVVLAITGALLWRQPQIAGHWRSAIRPIADVPSLRHATMMRDRRTYILALCGGLIGTSCSPTPAQGSGLTVVLSVPSEPTLRGSGWVQGTQDPARTPLPPDANSLAAALRDCGVSAFQLERETHWEAVTFPSSSRDQAIIRCVAGQVQFGFTAERTADWPIDSDSRLTPVRG
jgi:hypothetical protein